MEEDSGHLLAVVMVEDLGKEVGKEGRQGRGGRGEEAGARNS